MLAGFAFAIFYATLGLPVARWADKGNRVNIIGIALALWSAMTAVCGLAQNFVQLLLARIGVGIGEAGSSPPSHSIIADLYPPEKRAGAMGIYSLGVVLGVAGGSMIGGTLAHFFGWRVAMFAVGIPGIILAVVIKLFVVEPRRGLSDPDLLATSTVPAPALVLEQVDAAAALAAQLAAALDYVGVLTCEFFATADGPVFNEMAPRVHNSGHWTIEGAVTSQFENHIRAICGLPLGSTALTGTSVEMQNLIGDEANDWPAFLVEGDGHLHLYGKNEARPGRKMGHVTRVRR